MKRLLFILLPLSLLACAPAFGVTLEELQQRLKPMPTVPEDELPALPNTPEPFPGLIEHEGYEGHVWVRFPFVENPGSFGFDRQGRLYVVAANRFWLGVPDLRGINEFVRGDFRSVTVGDRQALYDAYPDRVPENFYTRVADRIIRLEDRDGNGAADHRTLFSERFRQPLEGLAFSILPEDDAVYLTNIPNLWKMTDPDGDGVADTHEAIVEGFGVRVSFIGHDLHGIIRGPDGRLYFSVGDRGYHVTADDGTVHSAPGRGAVFRCDSDGSNFEVYAFGLRNPQELAFDDHGNLFTFDNTGDIGDVARMVYVLDGSDSGWKMAHQSAHHYREILDWESFHPPKSMWVEERMFDTWNEEQPQWVYPPASHVARGPSGVTFLTGAAVPEDLRGKFLLANYRGVSPNCTALAIGIEPSGAGYVATSEDVFAKGVGVSDVELGYDGNIYLCDFGGGWSINTNGAIQALVPKDDTLRAAGREAQEWFRKGVKAEPIEQLTALLSHSDRRLRQLAQFELAGCGDEGIGALAATAGDSFLALSARLHGIWGLGMAQREHGSDTIDILLELTEDSEDEIRANAARTLGDLGATGARDRLVALTADDSPRVRSLAAIALGRVADRGDETAIDALYALAARTGAEETLDPVLRHAALSALDRIGTVESAVARAGDGAFEVRLTALLFLRRHESPEAQRFLADSDPVIVREAVRAIYETAAVDGPAGDALGSLKGKAAELPAPLQRRLVAAHYRRGTADHARGLLAIAGDEAFDGTVREAALHALRLWEKQIDTDPVMGTYRPIADGGPDRSLAALGRTIEEDLQTFLGENPPPALAALALRLADDTGVALDPAILREQIANTKLEPGVRVAALDSLVHSAGAQATDLVGELLDDPASEVAAAAIRHGFLLDVAGIVEAARGALISGPLAPARAGLEGLVKRHPDEGVQLWGKRESGVRPELWLDLFLALQSSNDETARAAATAFAGTAPFAVHHLGETGGDPARGEIVFRNQGACLQCHKVGREGGIQGPTMDRIGDRLAPDKLVESLVNPNAEIAEGYGMSTVSRDDGSMVMGRIARETKDTLTVVAIDGTETVVLRDEVASIAPPISAMPPLGASLPPRDLRDLVAFLGSRTSGKKGAKKKDDASHGEDDEAIAK